MIDPDWTGTAITAARPQAVAALLRYFRSLDLAEDAFQDAALRALKTWPVKGPPRDPTAWLIMVGRNAALDYVRRHSKQTELPPEETLSDLDDAEADLVERLDTGDYRDDVLRLLFVCSHPDLPPVHQVTLALRIVCGLSVPQIARAFFTGEKAMEQRITRAKARIAQSDVPYGVPSPAERADRVYAVATMIYLVFNEGYTGNAKETEARAPLCDEAIRLARLLMRLFPAEPEIMGLTALLLLQNSRAAARFDGNGEAVLLDQQDRSLWDQRAIAEGIALIDKAIRHRQPGAFQVQAAIAAIHARAATPDDTDWAQIERLYRTLEQMQPSPVVTLNRAVALAKIDGSQAALDLIAPLAEALDGYYYYHGAVGMFSRQMGDVGAAREAFIRAIACSKTLSEAAHIRRQLDQLAAEFPADRNFSRDV
ncbi:RNA polymerase sigma factor, sigma-70 family protein [Asticcacaulis biprosthecium C19]|uniref:RNA polymerase sigma factor, sigma-70 family protein n=1 Tax=Asticcacaulis biprosthecium C19 TaxID=715226 RepID=F4QIP0_9CAUL|nr:RNA polymerase sigma factor [Asticcacaulis biprosthecium]EGF91799.1 RNA polymerase sigma factor, sigma-70 family protein [Asticcacaulis biprosthecium C19]